MATPPLLGLPGEERAPAAPPGVEPPELSVTGSRTLEFTADSYAADVKELKTIGSGSFGAAILIETESTGERFVAKKISLDHMAQDEQVKAQNEASLLRSLRHPNITEYLGSFVAGNTLHIVMEYCSGGTLQQAMARRERAAVTFEEEEVFDWFLQARHRQRATVRWQPVGHSCHCGFPCRFYH